MADKGGYKEDRLREVAKRAIRQHHMPSPGEVQALIDEDAEDAKVAEEYGTLKPGVREDQRVAGLTHQAARAAMGGQEVGRLEAAGLPKVMDPLQFAADSALLGPAFKAAGAAYRRVRYGSPKPNLSVQRAKLEEPDFPGPTSPAQAQAQMRTVMENNYGASAGKFKPVEPDDPKLLDFLGDTQALNPNGTPVIVYRGMEPGQQALKIRTDPGKLGDGSEVFGRGNYFSTDVNMAKEFGKNIYPVYLKVTNPFVFGQTQYTPEMIKMIRKFAPGKTKNMTDADIQFYFSQAHDAGPTRFITGPQLTKVLQSGGHDGAVAAFGPGNTTFVTFTPNQAKSAISNTGDFDPRNPALALSGLLAAGAVSEQAEGGD